MTGVETRQTEALETRILFADDELSVERLTLVGLSARMIHRFSTRTCSVVGGEGTLEICGEFRNLHVGDSFTVPAGTPYQAEGTLDILAISVPPFDPGSIDYVG